MGVPEDVCKFLTKPVRTTNLNYEEVTNLVKRGKVNYFQKGNRKKLLKFSTPNIDIGDVAHAQLMFGDLVVLNRQPTLDKPCVVEFRVVPQKVKTFKINLSATNPFNADLMEMTSICMFLKSYIMRLKNLW